MSRLQNASNTIRRSRIQEGRPFPLGATWDGLGVNFALFSANATKVELCLFDNDGQARARADRRCRNTPTRSGTAICRRRAPARVYGYRVHGPYEPAAGHRFNPNKLLLDPYAKALVGQLRWSRRPFRLPSRLDRATTCRSTAATARAGMPKCRVVDRAFTWGNDRAPRIPWERHDHLRDPCPRLHHAAPRDVRRSCAAPSPASAHQAVIDYIKSLGITSIELLPIHAFVDDRHLLERALRNYWGYNTIGFFAPEPRYHGDAASVDEFKDDGARASTMPGSR